MKGRTIHGHWILAGIVSESVHFGYLYDTTYGLAVLSYLLLPPLLIVSCTIAALFLGIFVAATVPCSR
jgi:hypothetical protein